MGVMWQFPAFAVALGASYFRRLLAAKPHLALAARRCPAFGAYCCGAQVRMHVRSLAMLKPRPDVSQRVTAEPVLQRNRVINPGHAAWPMCGTSKQQNRPP
jgi:hypothetical protein